MITPERAVEIANTVLRPRDLDFRDDYCDAPNHDHIDELARFVLALARPVREHPIEPGAGGDRGPWMGTFTGKRFHFFDPRPEDVELADVAHHLSQICRYGGATRRTYSVAEHSVIVSLYVPPEYAREALLHDAAEAYVGDVIRPIKRKIGDGFAETERAVEVAVFARFGVTPTAESRAAVKEVDDRIIRDEIDALMSDPGIYAEREWLRGMKPLGCAIAALAPRAAEHVFLQRFLEVFAGTPHARAAADLLGIEGGAGAFGGV